MFRLYRIWSIVSSKYTLVKGIKIFQIMSEKWYLIYLFIKEKGILNGK